MSSNKKKTGIKVKREGQTVCKKELEAKKQDRKKFEFQSARGSSVNAQ